MEGEGAVGMGSLGLLEWRKKARGQRYLCRVREGEKKETETLGEIN